MNNKTDEAVNFFGLEIELWRIGDSAAAPKFNIVSKPNDWTATVSETARGIVNAAPTPTGQLQREYWEVFRAYVLEGSFLKPQSALPRYSLILSVGQSGFQLSASVSSREPWIQAALVLYDAKRDVEWFTHLMAERDAIHMELGHVLPWDNPPDGVKEARMALRLQPADYHDRDDWLRQHAWLRETLEAMYRVFAPRLKALPSDRVQAALETDESDTALDAS